MTELVIPNNVRNIGKYAFAGCSSLTSVTIPDRVRSIGESAFYKCSGLTSVTIGNSVTSIGKEAFFFCESLTSVTIPDSVESIDADAFDYCRGLTSIVIESDASFINAGLGFIKDNIRYSVLNKNSVKVVNNSYSGDVIIPSTVAFGNTFTVTIIGEAFKDCSGLTSVTIPDSVESIDADAFNNCTGLTSVMLGNGITSIGSTAFSNCTNLATLNIKAAVPPGMGSNVFRLCIALETIYVPSASVETYKTANGWSSFESKITAGDF